MTDTDIARDAESSAIIADLVEALRIAGDFVEAERDERALSGFGADHPYVADANETLTTIDAALAKVKRA